MNRRDFTRGLLSLGLVPALPAPVLSAGSAGVSATANHMYFMGWYTARMSDTCSPDILVSKLKVKPEVAREIFGELVKSNTLSPPDALGVSRTVDPLPQRFKAMSSRVAKADMPETSKTPSKRSAVSGEADHEAKDVVDTAGESENPDQLTQDAPSMLAEEGLPEQDETLDAPPEQDGETLSKADGTL